MRPKFFTVLYSQIHIKPQAVVNGTAHHLPASKSISNRVLILNALAGNTSTLHNLSNANDTHLMRQLVGSSAPLIDVEDAGTTMRFLTAYFAITGQNKTLTGTARMQERPIGILVDALQSLGANIRYENKNGYPPIILEGFHHNGSTQLTIRGDVSSQFISAVMMIAPCLPQGLTINLSGKIGSRPYIEMTAALMKKFGATCAFEEDTIQIAAGTYTPTELFVESDWSGASYWYSFAALAEESSLALPHLFADSLQGDQAIQKIMPVLGVQTRMDNGTVYLSKHKAEAEISWDFTHCPDLAQTVAVICAAKGIKGYFTGLESLRIKETDRIAALQTELKKIGADLHENNNTWQLVPSQSLPGTAQFNTYKDHRMAMAFAPLATKMDVIIENPSVVRKSYPLFWDDLKAIGFNLKQIAS